MASDYKLGEVFNWDGVTLKVELSTGKGCTHCYFNRKDDERKSAGCVDHVCEHRYRVNDNDVKFIKQKKGEV